MRSKFIAACLCLIHRHTATVSDGEIQASSLIGELVFIALATQFLFSEMDRLL
jgi:hypothetical protein